MKNEIKQFLIGSATAALSVVIVVSLLVLTAGCAKPSVVKSENYVEVGDSGGSGTLQIVEFDGHKFAIFVGRYKSSMVEIHDDK